MAGLHLSCSVSRYLEIFCIFMSDYSILIVFGKSPEFCWQGKLSMWRNQRGDEAQKVKDTTAVTFAPVNLICGYQYSCCVIPWTADDCSVFSPPNVNNWALWSGQASFISSVRSWSCVKGLLFSRSCFDFLLPWLHSKVSEIFHYIGSSTWWQLSISYPCGCQQGFRPPLVYSHQPSRFKALLYLAYKFHPEMSAHPLLMFVSNVLADWSQQVFKRCSWLGFLQTCFGTCVWNVWVRMQQPKEHNLRGWGRRLDGAGL